MARYLVTGAAGFVAAKVCEFLLDDGHAVEAVDNLNSSYDARLKQWRLDRLLKRPGFRFDRLDITDRAALAALWDQAGTLDAVINLAARAGVRQSLEDPWGYLETNVSGALNLLELCRSRGPAHLLQASTSSLYGALARGPCPEDAEIGRPLSPYAASKRAAEGYCDAYHHLYGLDVTVLRYFTVYGPAGRPDMLLFRLVQWIAEDRPVRIYGDGRQQRDFTYVDDIARGTIAALKVPGHETFNLGSDRPVALMDAVALVEQLVGRKARLEFHPRLPADVPSTWADISRARNHLGWQPQTPYEDGVRRCVDWYRQNRAWAKDIVTI